MVTDGHPTPQQAEKHGMRRHPANSVGWRMTGVALAFLVSLDIGIAGYTIMYVQGSDQRILNNQEEILRRLPPR